MGMDVICIVFADLEQDLKFFSISVGIKLKKNCKIQMCEPRNLTSSCVYDAVCVCV